jgi:hypothetical protein
VLGTGPAIMHMYDTCMAHVWTVICLVRRPALSLSTPAWCQAKETEPKDENAQQALRVQMQELACRQLARIAKRLVLMHTFSYVAYWKRETQAAQDLHAEQTPATHVRLDKAGWLRHQLLVEAEHVWAMRNPEQLAQVEAIVSAYILTISGVSPPSFAFPCTQVPPR